MSLPLTVPPQRSLARSLCGFVDVKTNAGSNFLGRFRCLALLSLCSRYTLALLSLCSRSALALLPRGLERVFFHMRGFLVGLYLGLPAVRRSLCLWLCPTPPLRRLTPILRAHLSSTLVALPLQLPFFFRFADDRTDQRYAYMKCYPLPAAAFYLGADVNPDLHGMA